MFTPQGIVFREEENSWENKHKLTHHLFTTEILNWMRRWDYLYNSTCTNCSKLNLALVSMHLLNSISLDKGIQQGSPSVCIWHSMLLKRNIPHDLNINFLLYRLLCWFISLRKNELCLYCRWFWADHITSEHQGPRLYQSTGVMR